MAPELWECAGPGSAEAVRHQEPGEIRFERDNAILAGSPFWTDNDAAWEWIGGLDWSATQAALRAMLSDRERLIDHARD